MIVIDTNVLSIFLYENCSVPNDFRTKQPIPRARERVQALISEIEKNGDRVVIPAPVLGEALVVAAPDVWPYLDILNSSPHFRISPFGEKAAIEVALHLKAAKIAGDKRDGLAADECIWDKVNFDRQIVAIAKVEGASTIYSTDRHVHLHAEKWGIDCKNISDVVEPQLGLELFNEPEEDKQATRNEEPEPESGVAAPAKMLKDNGPPVKAETPASEATGAEGDSPSQVVDRAVIEPATPKSQEPPPE